MQSDGDNSSGEGQNVDFNILDSALRPGTVDPLVNRPVKGFGLSFTDAQRIETSLIHVLIRLEMGLRGTHAWIQFYSTSWNKRFSCEKHTVAAAFGPFPSQTHPYQTTW
jgi:hypothetical protein